MSPIDNDQFRFEDYKLKLAHLNAQADRMWTRFNYFVTIEAGLVGIFALASAGQFRERVPWAALAEFLISVVWWTVGARDRFLWRSARRNVERAAGDLRVDGTRILGYRQRYTSGYIPVGEHDPPAEQLHAETVRKPGWRFFRVRLASLAGARDTRFGVTLIPMLIPACLTGFWWLGFVAALAWSFANLTLLVLLLPPLAIVLALWRPFRKARVLIIDGRDERLRSLMLRELEGDRFWCQTRPGTHYRPEDLRLGRFEAVVIVTTDGNPYSASSRRKRKLVAAIRDANPHISIFAMPAGAVLGNYEGELLEVGITGVAAGVSQLSALLGHANYKYFFCLPSQLATA